MAALLVRGGVTWSDIGSDPCDACGLLEPGKTPRKGCRTKQQRTGPGMPGRIGTGGTDRAAGEDASLRQEAHAWEALTGRGSRRQPAPQDPWCWVSKNPLLEKRLMKDCYAMGDMASRSLGWPAKGSLLSHPVRASDSTAGRRPHCRLASILFFFSQSQALKRAVAVSGKGPLRARSPGGFFMPAKRRIGKRQQVRFQKNKERSQGRPLRMRPALPRPLFQAGCTHPRVLVAGSLFGCGRDAMRLLFRSPGPGGSQQPPQPAATGRRNSSPVQVKSASRNNADNTIPASKNSSAICLAARRCRG